jgi:hypothetical protein
MATFTKEELSGSTDGRGIKVVATATAGTTIHTAQADTGTDNYDEVWLYAVNSDTASIKLTIEWGGTTSPDDTIEMTIGPEEGLVLIIPGMVLQNSLVVKAFAGSANLIVIHGWVNRISA